MDQLWLSAKLAGLVKYVSDRPCRNCRAVERYVSSKGCVRCAVEGRRQRDERKRLSRPSRSREAIRSRMRAEEMAERQAAQDAGRKTYTTMRPCKHGHVGARYAQTGACLECLANYAKRHRERCARFGS